MTGAKLALLVLLASCWSSSDPSGPSSDLARCLRGRVVKLRFIGNASEAVIARGHNDGVRANWSINLENLTRTPAEILRIDPSSTIVELELTPDQVSRYSVARLCPPA